MASEKFVCSSPPQYWFGGFAFSFIVLVMRWAHKQDVDIHAIFYLLVLVAIGAMRRFGMRAQSLDVAQFVAMSLNVPRLIVTLEGVDNEFKHRSLGMYAILVRALLPHFVHRQLLVVVAALILLANEMYYTSSIYHDQMPLRVRIVLILMSVMCVWYAKRQHRQWRMLSDAQRALAEEKAAQEALISMLCDSCAHIGVDGDTVEQSAHHFETIIGEEVRGAKLSDYLPAGKEEKARVAEAFVRARTSPVNLPLTLLSKWAENRMDMFIVRRSSILADSEQGRESGFLVGFRFAHDGIDTIGDMVGSPPSFFENGLGEHNASMSEGQVIRGSVPSEWGFETSSRASIENHHVAESPLEIREGELDPKPEANMTRRSSLESQTTVVWSDRFPLPKPLDAISLGDRILCYDNIANGMAYATVTSITQNDETWSDCLTLTMEDGSMFNMRLDQPVAAQASDDDLQPLQGARTCVRAADLQAGKSKLMVMRIMPMLVSSMESHSQEHRPAEQRTPVICVEQPERYEPLMASCSKNLNRAGQPIAISSYDRLTEGGITLREKHTFLCCELDNSGKDSRSTRSAPPSVHGGLWLAPSALSCADLKFADATSKPIVQDLEDAVSQTFAPSLAEASEASSEQTASDHSKLTVKVGNVWDCSPFQGFRLSSLYSLKQSCLPSLGTGHAPNDCRPCRFFHSPKSCRASFMCEYCHDEDHFRKLSRRLRKIRPCDR